MNRVWLKTEVVDGGKKTEFLLSTFVFTSWILNYLHVLSIKIKYSWPLNNEEVQGTGPAQLKIAYNFWLPPNLSYPLVFMEDWFQDPLPIPKSTDAQVPYIKW